MDKLSSNTVLNRAFWLKWYLAFFLAALIVILATLPPFLPAEWRSLIMLSFSNICHQIPDRSPHIEGISLAVCHRCYGIYFGIPLAIAGFLFLYALPVRTTTLRFVVLGTITLMLVDWAAPFLGLWHNTVYTRMVTGLLFGVTAGFYLMHVIAIQGEMPSQMVRGIMPAFLSLLPNNLEITP